MKYLTEALLWFLLVMATGFWFGLFQYVGWDTGRVLIVKLIEALGK